MVNTTSSRRNQTKQQNVRLPFIGSMTNRDSSSSKDQRYVNIFPETRKVDQIESTKIFLNKRPGLTSYRDFGTGEGRGCIYFNGKFYVAVANKLYEDSGTPITKITFSTSTGNIGLLVANSSTIGDYLFVCDGVDAWYITTSGTVTEITDDQLREIIVTIGGEGYQAAPIVYVTGGGGTGAVGSSVITDGIVTSVGLSNRGSGYTSAPTISFGFKPSADNTTDIITYNSHGLADNDRVSFSGGTGVLPTGITALVSYYVVNSTTNTFKISLTSGGGAVDFSTNGTAGFDCHTGGPTVAIATATSYVNAFPTPHITTPVFIDGYVVLAKGSDVYTCDLDSPGNWNSSNYLSAEMFPDAIKCLARQNNQVVALGSSSIEFFYDAANATGSPFSRNDSTTNQMGAASSYAVYQNEKFLLFIGQSDSGGRAVWKVEGFQPTRVSDEFIDRIIDSETNIVSTYGYGVRTMGHLFYIINLPTVNRTLVYDVDEKLWHEWSSSNTGTHNMFSYNHSCDNNAGALYVLHTSNGILYKLDPTKYQDDSTEIITEIITNRFDMDTIKRKFMSNIRWVGDRYPTNSIELRWTDDDYQTWSGWKTISLSDDFPNFSRMGAFRRRAFHWKHTTNYPLRGESFEVTFLEGDS